MNSPSKPDKATHSAAAAKHHFVQAVQAHQKGHRLQALAHYDQALTQKSKWLEVWSNLGLLFKQLRKHDKALYCLEKALQLQPDHPGCLSNRAGVYIELARYEECLADSSRALAAQPDHAVALLNQAVATYRLGRLRQARTLLIQALNIHPDHVEIHFTLGLLELLHGDYAAGFRRYERRWELPSVKNKRKTNKAPLWLGQFDLRGQTILLQAEQGLGDTLQFARYAQRVQAMGARVVMEVQPALRGLLTSLAGVDEWRSLGDPAITTDAQCPLMSLPLALGLQQPDQEAAPAYLRPDPERVETWRTRLGPRRKPRVGLVYRGNPTHVNDVNRSGSLRTWIAHLPTGLDYVVLQHEVTPDDQALARQSQNVTLLGPEFKDFSDTAAVCSLLDLVITVDTSVAHLCGALGLPTWILLPMVPDWRWGAAGDRTPWYASVRLWRQKRPQGWAELLGRVRSALQSRFHLTVTPPALYLASNKPLKRVGVLTYNNVGNFGDRLGMHNLAQVLPENAVIERLNFKPWKQPSAPYDLLIIGIGNSIFAPILKPELYQLIQSAKVSIGIFGTQYREEYATHQMRSLVSLLDVWYARSKQDLALYGTPMTECVHLGDWLIDQFPMTIADPALPTLKVGAEVLRTTALDRVIEKIQKHPRVYSERLHPLLCALTSATEVAYKEQRESGSGHASGKFGSLLLDVFGQIPPEEVFWRVDPLKVIAYKAHVKQAMEAMRNRLAHMLA